MGNRWNSTAVGTEFSGTKSSHYVTEWRWPSELYSVLKWHISTAGECGWDQSCSQAVQVGTGMIFAGLALVLHFLTAHLGAEDVCLVLGASATLRFVSGAGDFASSHRLVGRVKHI